MIPTDSSAAPTISARPGRYPVLNFAKLIGKNAPAGAAGNTGATDGAHPPVDHNAVRRVVGRMPPPPLTPMQQAQQLVSREITPLQNAIAGSYTGMANAGGNAIRQATDAYASALAGEHDQLTQPYQQAEQGAAASQDAFANRLTGAGTAASDELAQRLASIGEPGAVNPVASALAGKAAAAGNAVYGTGNATLDQLLGEGAAAEGYASKLPGVARTAGLQQLGQFESGLTASEGKDMLALEEKAPALVQSAYGTLASAAGKQASIDASNARTAATLGERSREFDAAQATKGAAADASAAKFDATQAGKAADRKIKEQAAQWLDDYRSGRLGLSEAQANEKAKEFLTKMHAPNASLSRTYGYQVDGSGNPVGGKITPIAGYRLNADGTGVVKVATPRSSSSTATGARQAYKQAVAIATKAAGTQILGQSFSKPYNVAFNEVESYLTGAGMSASAARRLALKALGAAGYTSTVAPTGNLFSGAGVNATP